MTTKITIQNTGPDKVKVEEISVGAGVVTEAQEIPVGETGVFYLHKEQCLRVSEVDPEPEQAVDGTAGADSGE